MSPPAAARSTSCACLVLVAPVTFGGPSSGVILTTVGTSDAAANAMVVTSSGDIIVAGYGSDAVAGHAAMLAEFTAEKQDAFGDAGLLQPIDLIDGLKCVSVA